MIAQKDDSQRRGWRLFRLVDELVEVEGFDTEEFVIAGSARLWLQGIKPTLRDLDLVARGGTWQRAQELGLRSGPPRISQHTKTPIIQLYGGRIEVCDCWVPPLTCAEYLIATAGITGGYRVITVDQIELYKRWLKRPQDKADLRRLESFRASLAPQHNLTGTSVLPMTNGDVLGSIPTQRLTARDSGTHGRRYRRTRRPGEYEAPLAPRPPSDTATSTLHAGHRRRGVQPLSRPGICRGAAPVRIEPTGRPRGITADGSRPRLRRTARHHRSTVSR